MTKTYSVVQNQLLFDINNPNCKILTPIFEIADMLAGIPVICNETDYVAGVIKEVTNITDTQIFGDIIYWFDKEYSEMFNYEFNTKNRTGQEGNYEVEVESVVSIFVKEIR